MKNLRDALIISIIVFSMIAFSMTAYAQQGTPPAGAPQAGGQGAPPAGGGGGGESRFDQINKAVNLTPDQQVKVKAELKQTDDEIAALREKAPTWNDEAKAAIDKIWVKETDSSKFQI